LDRDPFRWRKARKNAVSRSPKRPRMASKEVKTGRNGSQDRGSGCGGREGCRGSGVVPRWVEDFELLIHSSPPAFPRAFAPIACYTSSIPPQGTSSC
jgi:hypothetical protein